MSNTTALINIMRNNYAVAYVASREDHLTRLLLMLYIGDLNAA